MARKKILLSDVITDFQAFLYDEGKSDLTVKNYINDLSQFQAYCQEKGIVDLKGAGVVAKDYAAEVKKSLDVKTTTANRKVIALRQFFHFVWISPEYNHIIGGSDPMAKVKIKKVQGGGQHSVKWLKREDVEEILAAIPQLPKTNALSIARNRSVILTLVNCGLRVGELSELRLMDVNFEKGILSVRQGKGNKFRQVPITNGTLEALKQWLEIRRKNDGELLSTDYLYNSERSPKLSERGVQHLTKNLSAIAGVEFSPHTLRHTYCKNVADATGKLQVVAELAGHSNINTTRIYTSPSMDELTKVVEGVEFNVGKE